MADSINWDNVINSLNKRMSSIAEHMGVDSTLYNQYETLVDMGLDYDYRPDGTIKIKRNTNNKNPDTNAMNIFKKILDLDRYSDVKKKAKEKLDDTDTSDYDIDDMIRDMDFVKGNIDKALEVVYNHITEGTDNDADYALLDALEQPEKPGYKELADLIRSVYDNALNDADDFDFADYFTDIDDEIDY